MKRTLIFAILAAALAVSATAQGRSADAIKKQIHDLKADKSITLTYDQSSDSSKIMAVSGNFDDKETSAAGLQAMNFALAVNFSGKDLKERPAAINLSFWAMSKKPRFAASHRWTVTWDKDTADLGDARYGARASENMEYLNFVLSPADLKKAAVAGAKYRLGDHEFTLSGEQAALLTNMLVILAL